MVASAGLWANSNFSTFVIEVDNTGGTSVFPAGSFEGMSVDTAYDPMIGWH